MTNNYKAHHGDRAITHTDSDTIHIIIIIFIIKFYPVVLYLSTSTVGHNRHKNKIKVFFNLCFQSCFGVWRSS